MLGFFLRQSLALGLGEFLELLFAHRFIHALGSAFELALLGLAALCGECGSGCFLLGFRGGWHGRFSFIAVSEKTRRTRQCSGDQATVSPKPCIRRLTAKSALPEVKTAISGLPCG